MSASFNQFGQSLVFVYNEEKHTCTIKDKKERDEKIEKIKELFVKLEATKSDKVAKTLSNKIIKLMEGDGKKEFEKKESETKAKKKVIKNKKKNVKSVKSNNKDLIKDLENKELSTDEISKLQSIIDKNKKQSSNTKSVTAEAPKRRRGEY